MTDDEWLKKVGELCDSCIDPHARDFVSYAMTGDGVHVLEATHRAMCAAIQESRLCIHNSMGDGTGWFNPATEYWKYGLKYAPSEEDPDTYVWVVWSK